MLETIQSPSIFETQSIDREKVKWEDHLFDLTPIQAAGDILFKREDFFAPLGYGGVNGSKLRQAIFLVDGWIRKNRIRGVVSAGVSGSPQHAFMATICKHYGIESKIITGTRSAIGKSLELADKMGSTFIFEKVGYAKTLERRAVEFAQKNKGYAKLDTNITVDGKTNTHDKIESFHAIGAAQTMNIPDDVETLIIPCGSCNSVTSIFYGIALSKPKSLREVLLVGIGNNGSKNIHYIANRLKQIEKVINRDITSIFRKEIKRTHIDIYDLGGYKYSDLVNFNYGGIDFHPRYEGKIFDYINRNPDYFKRYMNKKTLFWIVGSEIL